MSIHSIVLRYYDFDYETIKEHLEIINKKDFAWWAWWKKLQEPWQQETLAEIASRCPIQIGLANRVAKDYYLAKCEKVVFEKNGSGTPSPDVEFTPPYYRHSVHPAWFKISAINKTTAEEFVSNFGGIPKGEATLFLVKREGEVTTLIDEGIQNPDSVKTRGDSILHLSDLHFGEDHGYAPIAPKTPITKRSLSQVVDEIVRSLGGLTIGMVVISGDLITKGAPEGYVVAQNSL